MKTSPEKIAELADQWYAGKRQSVVNAVRADPVIKEHLKKLLPINHQLALEDRLNSPDTYNDDAVNNID